MGIVAVKAVGLVEGLVLVRLLQVCILGDRGNPGKAPGRLGQMKIELGFSYLVRSYA